jgi:RNase P subunit RPR2
MVDIVKMGKTLCTCKKCNSQLAYNHSEVKEYKVNHDYLGDYDIITGITCPVCNVIIRIKNG